MDCSPHVLEARRARRRRITETVAQRRRSEYVFFSLGGDPSGNHQAETSPYYWAKQSIGSCTCRKHHHGAPRRDKGMCDRGARDRIYRLRAQTRELVRLTLRGVDLESDALTLLHGACKNDLW